MSEAIEKTRSVPVFAPWLDIAEKKDEFMVWADMPGADPKSVEISLEGEMLTVRAKVGPPEVKLPLLYREYVVGDFEAGLRITAGVDREKITADLKDGVLVLTLPKAEEVKPRKIEIKAA